MQNAELLKQNRHLLGELENAYRQLAEVFERANLEKNLAYQELQNKLTALERLYADKMRQENLLVHLQKLSSIGQFMAEIIHEMRNPLTAISAHADILLMNGLPANQAQHAQAILQLVNTTSHHLNKFMNMAHGEEAQFTIFDAGECLAEVIEMVGLLKPKEIELAYIPCDRDLPVWGDPEQLSQIVLNISRNAFEALKRHGSWYRIEVQQVLAKDLRPPDAVHVQSDTNWQMITELSRRFACITFRDNAGGIPAELMPRLFEAFFTTKSKSDGTGLGLYIVADIVKRFNGDLFVESQKNAGTTITLYLPIKRDRQRYNELT